MFLGCACARMLVSFVKRQAASSEGQRRGGTRAMRGEIYLVRQKATQQARLSWFTFIDTILCVLWTSDGLV